MEHKYKFKLENPVYFSQDLADPNPQTDKDEMETQSMVILMSGALKSRFPQSRVTVSDKCDMIIMNRLQPAQRWIKYPGCMELSFPVQTIKPKVQLTYIAPPGRIQREVKVERLIRRFSKRSLPEILREDGITPTQLLPTHILQNYMNDAERILGIFTTKYHRLPLEWFDDFEYTEMRPEDWIKNSIIDGTRYPIPGLAYLPVDDFRTNALKCIGSDFDIEKNMMKPEIKKTRTNTKLPEVQREYLYHWTTVATYDYDPVTYHWSVVDLVTQRKFTVPGIYLMFFASEPNIFSLRIQTALNARSIAERNLRFNLLVDSMILNDFAMPNKKVLDKITQWTFHNAFMKQLNPQWVDQLFNEIIMGYKKISARADLLHSISLDPLRYHFLEMPDPREKPPIREYMKSPMKPGKFQYVRRYLQFYCLYSIPETIQAIQLVFEDCLKLNKMSLYNYTMTRSLSLKDFEDIQSTYLMNTMTSLKSYWLEVLSGKLILSIRNSGKGWFDLTVDNWNIYNVSKLFRLMELVKHLMIATLRSFVERSVNRYITLVCLPCRNCLTIPDDYEWTTNLLVCPFPAEGYALFQTTMSIDTTGTYYSVNPDLYEPTLVRLLDEGVRQSHYIHRVDSSVLQGLVFPHDLYLSSVGMMAPNIVYNRNYLRFAIRRALIPLKAYKKRYDDFTEFYNMNIGEYINTFKAANHSSTEVKDEITMHLSVKARLEEILPATIPIGPFLVNVAPIRSTLIVKRGDCAAKLLDYFADRLRLNSEDLCEQYTLIFRRLSETASNVETLFETRDWMETVPDKVQKFEERMKTAMYDYDILDHFLYNLSNEDFKYKYDAIAWPLKIMRQIDVVKYDWDNRIEYFQKLQLSDIVAYTDISDNLNAQIQTYSTNNDTDRVHEYAVEIQKIWKMLVDCKNNGELYSKRQAYFGEDPLNMDQINEMFASFIPYRKLWTTASKFIKNIDVYTGNPLVTVDVDKMQEDIANTKKTFQECLQLFSELPLMTEVTQYFIDLVEDFQPKADIIIFVRNPDWLVYHWQELVKTSEMEFKFTTSLSLNFCIAKGIMNFHDLVKDISFRATNDKEEYQRHIEELERKALEEELAREAKKNARRGRKI